MKVTFSPSLCQEVDTFPVSNRVISEILNRDDRIDAKMNSSLFLTYNRSFKSHLDIYKNNPILEEKFKGIRYITNIMRLFESTKHSKILIDSIDKDSECLLYSAGGSMYDFLIIRDLLQHGIKVLAGGSMFFFVTFSEFRKKLKKFGCTRSELKNLIMVKGYADLTTDLYKIITDWKDVEIKSNDLSTILDCSFDYIQPIADIYEKVRHSSGKRMTDLSWQDSYVNFIFNNKCFWNKCRFCTYSTSGDFDCASDASPEYIIEHIVNTMKLYKANQLFIVDDYFLPTKKNTQIIKTLSEKHDIRIGIYSGIRMLIHKEYTKTIGKYCSHIKVGMESTSDFALEWTNKGFTNADIKVALDNIIKYADKRLTVQINLIFDLPMRDKEDIITHFQNVYDYKEKMITNGFNIWNYSPKLLIVSKNDKMVDNKYLVDCSLEDDHVIGRMRLWKYYTQYGLIDRNIALKFGRPIKRLDVNGNVLPSDFNYLSDDMAEYLSHWSWT